FCSYPHTPFEILKYGFYISIRLVWTIMFERVTCRIVEIKSRGGPHPNSPPPIHINNSYIATAQACLVFSVILRNLKIITIVSVQSIAGSEPHKAFLVFCYACDITLRQAT